MKLIKELSKMADELLEIYNQLNEISDDWSLNHEEIRDEIKALSGSVIDQIEKIKDVYY